MTDPAQAPEPDTEALTIVLALAAADPVVDGHLPGPYCALCDAEPPGATGTLLQGQHRPDCPWRQARQLSDAMIGWNRPPEPQPGT